MMNDIRVNPRPISTADGHFIFGALGFRSVGPVRIVTMANGEERVMIGRTGYAASYFFAWREALKAGMSQDDLDSFMTPEAYFALFETSTMSRTGDIDGLKMDDAQREDIQRALMEGVEEWVIDDTFSAREQWKMASAYGLYRNSPSNFIEASEEHPF